MKRNILVVLLLCAEIFVAASPSQAIPAFARKYGFNCNMCHTAYPKLNDFGQRFRDDGYQIPGQEGKEANVFATPPPLALRTSTGATVYNAKEGTTFGFNLYGFDLLASGVLHKNVSFLLIYTPRIDEPAADYNGRNPSQLAALESASLIFSNLITDSLNLRIGRFEPAYHAFSSKRSFYLFSPYEIYDFRLWNDFLFNENQMGIELNGHLRQGTKYSLGVVNGSGANPDRNKNKDVYFNFFQTIGRGDGQSAGQRLGVFGYYGWQSTKYFNILAPTGEVDGKDNKSFYRLGVDGSFNWRTWNLELLWMKGVNDKELNPFDNTKNYEYTGWFAELDYALLLNNRLVTSLLYNQVSPPNYFADEQINAVSALVRYYLGDWSAVNISIHAEYSHRVTGKTDKVKDDLFALLVDFAF